MEKRSSLVSIFEWSSEEQMNRAVMLNTTHRKALDEWLKGTVAQLSGVKFAGVGEVKEIKIE